MRDVFLYQMRGVLGLFIAPRHWWGQVNARSLRYDFFAGLIGATLALPQGIAFALIAGLPPEFGLYSAIVVQILAGFFGSSLHMVTGPTVALSVMIPSVLGAYAVVGSPHYIGLSLSLMFLVGIIQLAFALFRLGGLVNFISHTVVVGFTAGAGLLIVFSQLPVAFGLDLPRGLSFFERFYILLSKLSSVDISSFLVAFSTMAVALLLRRLGKRLPCLLLGLLFGVFLAQLLGFFGYGVRYLGALPSVLPQFSLPNLSFSLLAELFPAAFALALLGLIEAASIARSLAVRSKQMIDCNQEFFGQGIGNLLGSCCSCYVGSGSFNRSAMNYDAGAKTPLALFFTSFFVLLLLLFAPNLTRFLPMPAVAGVIVLSAFKLINFKEIVLIFQSEKSEFSIVLLTFLATLFLNLEFAIYVGVILSLVLYLQKTSHPLLSLVDFSKVLPVFEEGRERVNLAVLRLDGSLFFGAVNHVQNRLRELGRNQDWQYVVILGEGVNIIDFSGLEMLLAERKALQERGGDLFFIGMKPHLRRKLRMTPYWKPLGGQSTIFDSTYVAFRSICKRLGISNYREFMKHLFRDYNKI